MAFIGIDLSKSKLTKVKRMQPVQKNEIPPTDTFSSWKLICLNENIGLIIIVFKKCTV